jgi:hypothetical protein
MVMAGAKIDMSKKMFCFEKTLADFGEFDRARQYSTAAMIPLPKSRNLAQG